MQRISVLAVFLFAAAGAWATIFGSVRGIVHDPQHRPVPDTTVVLKALNSEFTESTQTNSEGEFHFEAVPLGEYTVSISDATFVAQPQTIVVLSGTAPILHLELRLPSEKETVTVSAEEGQGETVTPSTLVDRLQIQETPGASRSNSLAMITEFVPGAYIHQRQSTADDPRRSSATAHYVRPIARNVANRRVLLDNSFAFGGTHFLKPREIFVQLRYRFHY